MLFSLMISYLYAVKKIQVLKQYPLASYMVNSIQQQVFFMKLKCYHHKNVIWKYY